MALTASIDVAFVFSCGFSGVVGFLVRDLGFPRS